MNVKKLKTTAATIAVVMIVSCMTGYSQTNGITPPDVSPSVAIDWNATNWVVIPFLGYQVQQKQFGGGAAALYTVTPNLWTGVRFQSFGHQQATAGVQAQLQVTETFFGIKVTPFAEASTGIGDSSLYGNAGLGGVISFHTWEFGSNHHIALEVGVAADYEHYVFGSVSGNQINGGPLIHLRF